MDVNKMTYSGRGKRLATMVLPIALLAMMLPSSLSCLDVGGGEKAPQADFAASTTSGSCPLLVHFTAMCSGEVTDWAWDFDYDGRVDSTEQDPSYIYETAGRYSVSLEASGPGGSDIEIKAQYIEVAESSTPDPGGKPVIVIGNLTDFTGPASAALIPAVFALMDLVRYYNEEEFIPGAELRLVNYDAMSDPARAIPGYDWLTDRGARVIITPLTTDAETLRPFADKDEIPIWALSTSTPLLESPGWVFSGNAAYGSMVKTLLKWITENLWDYSQGKPKIGMVGWNEPYTTQCYQGMYEYSQDHPDTLEWVGGHFAPVGAVVWANEVEALKDCDYVFPPLAGVAAATFIKEFRDGGYAATLIGTDSIAAYGGMLLDSVGWGRLDGTLTILPTLWWSGTTPVIDLAKDILSRYRPGEVEDFIHSGIAYISTFHQWYAFFEILKKAIEAVGVESFNGRA
ncbi:ABC transporter substrate-binding protein, partial [Chloroflexota bacterium]